MIDEVGVDDVLASCCRGRSEFDIDVAMMEVPMTGCDDWNEKVVADPIAEFFEILNLDKVCFGKEIKKWVSERRFRLFGSRSTRTQDKFFCRKRPRREYLSSVSKTHNTKNSERNEIPQIRVWQWDPDQNHTAQRKLEYNSSWNTLRLFGFRSTRTQDKSFCRRYPRRECAIQWLST